MLHTHLLVNLLLLTTGLPMFSYRNLHELKIKAYTSETFSFKQNNADLKVCLNIIITVLCILND